MTNLKIGFIFLFAIALGCKISAQVIINEFSCANYNGYTFGGGWNALYNDYIEFHNPENLPADLENYWLSDDVNDPMQWQFPANSVVGAGGKLIVLISGRGDYDADYLGYLNTNFMVTQTKGEDIVFSDPNGNILEYYDFELYPPLQDNHSWGRSTDGGPVWKIFNFLTPGEANAGYIYNGYASTVQFSHEAGYYDGIISVTLSAANDDETIYYTLDGSTPIEFSTPYNQPITLAETTCLRAIAFSSDPDKLPGFIETNTYFFGDDVHTIPIVAISGSLLSDGTWGSGSEKTDIEFFEPNGSFITEAHGKSNEHGNDSNAYDQRGFDYITTDSRGFDHDVNEMLFHHSDRHDYERLIFKCAGNDNFSYEGDSNNFPGEIGGAHLREAYINELSILGELELDERKPEACVVYINGEYWGVYWMHEKVDDTDFFKHYYNQPRGWVDMLKTWGGTWYEYGDGSDWYDLVDFVTSNDMSEASNYDYVIQQIDPASLADFFILNSFIVNSDWLNWNNMWWRGRHPDGEAKRWRYCLWDMDCTFSHHINFTGIPDISPDASPCDFQDMGDVGGQGHIPLFNSMMENDQFYCYYVSRYYELANTALSCENMIAVLDSMVAVIDPEMPRQIERWPYFGEINYEGWLENVQALLDFILARCDSTIIAGLQECYEGITPSSITMIVEGAGEVEVNFQTITENDSPYMQVFCMGVESILTVNSNPDCGFFLGWQVVSGDVEIPDTLATEISFELAGDVEIIATFGVEEENPSAFVNVEPAGSGDILLNGNFYTDFPFLVEVGVGANNDFVAVPNGGFVFDHWETVNTSEIDDNESESMTVHLCEDGIVTAVFVYVIGIAENELHALIVYPNPAGKTITIAGDIVQQPIRIFNSLGQLVLEEKNLVGNEIDISALSQGLYSIWVGNRNAVMAVVR